MTKVSKINFKGGLKKSILETVNEIGGFKKFIKPGETVLLKPNLNTADPFPASTDLEFLRTIVELVYDYGAKLVMVGDSSTMSINTRKVMEKLKVFDLEKMERPARVYVFEERPWIKKEIPKGRYLKSVNLSEILFRPDKLILLPCLKTHFVAQFTGALKLSVGFMKPTERIWLHMGNVQEKVAELNTLINPHLIIMDARKCFICHGPAEGPVREPNLILASESRVSIDAEGVRIIQGFEGNSLEGIDPLEFPQIKRASDLNVS